MNRNGALVRSCKSRRNGGGNTEVFQEPERGGEFQALWAGDQSLLNIISRFTRSVFFQGVEEEAISFHFAYQLFDPRPISATI